MAVSDSRVRAESLSDAVADSDAAAVAVAAAVATFLSKHSTPLFARQVEAHRDWIAP